MESISSPIGSDAMSLVLRKLRDEIDCKSLFRSQNSKPFSSLPALLSPSKTLLAVHRPNLHIQLYTIYGEEDPCGHELPGFATNHLVDSFTWLSSTPSNPAFLVTSSQSSKAIQIYFFLKDTFVLGEDVHIHSEAHKETKNDILLEFSNTTQISSDFNIVEYSIPFSSLQRILKLYVKSNNTFDDFELLSNDVHSKRLFLTCNSRKFIISLACSDYGVLFDRLIDLGNNKLIDFKEQSGWIFALGSQTKSKLRIHTFDSSSGYYRGIIKLDSLLLSSSKNQNFCQLNISSDLRHASISDPDNLVTLKVDLDAYFLEYEPPRSMGSLKIFNWQQLLEFSMQAPKDDDEEEEVDEDDGVEFDVKSILADPRKERKERMRNLRWFEENDFRLVAPENLIPPWTPFPENDEQPQQNQFNRHNQSSTHPDSSLLLSKSVEKIHFKSIFQNIKNSKKSQQSSIETPQQTPIFGQEQVDTTLNISIFDEYSISWSVIAPTKLYTCFEKLPQSSSEPHIIVIILDRFCNHLSSPLSTFELGEPWIPLPDVQIPALYFLTRQHLSALLPDQPSSKSKAISKITSGLIIFDKPALAELLYALNDWDRKVLKLHTLKLGLKYRQLDVIENALNSLESDEQLKGSQMLLHFTQDQSSLVVQDEMFWSQLLKMSMEFVSSIMTSKSENVHQSPESFQEILQYSNVLTVLRNANQRLRHFIATGGEELDTSFQGGNDPFQNHHHQFNPLLGASTTSAAAAIGDEFQVRNSDSSSVTSISRSQKSSIKPSNQQHNSLSSTPYSVKKAKEKAEREAAKQRKEEAILLSVQKDSSHQQHANNSNLGNNNNRSRGGSWGVSGGINNADESSSSSSSFVHPSFNISSSLSAVKAQEKISSSYNESSSVGMASPTASNPQSPRFDSPTNPSSRTASDAVNIQQQHQTDSHQGARPIQSMRKPRKDSYGDLELVEDGEFSHSFGNDPSGIMFSTPFGTSVLDEHLPILTGDPLADAPDDHKLNDKHPHISFASTTPPVDPTTNRLNQYKDQPSLSSYSSQHSSKTDLRMKQKNLKNVKREVDVMMKKVEYLESKVDAMVEMSTPFAAYSRWDSYKPIEIIADALVKGHISRALSYLQWKQNMSPASLPPASNNQESFTSTTQAGQTQNGSQNDPQVTPSKSSTVLSLEQSYDHQNPSLAYIVSLSCHLIYQAIRLNKMEMAKQMIKNLGENVDLHLKSIAWFTSVKDIRQTLVPILVSNHMFNDDELATIALADLIEEEYPFDMTGISHQTFSQISSSFSPSTSSHSSPDAFDEDLKLISQVMDYQPSDAFISDSFASRNLLSSALELASEKRLQQWVQTNIHHDNNGPKFSCLRLAWLHQLRTTEPSLKPRLLADSRLLNNRSLPPFKSPLSHDQNDESNRHLHSSQKIPIEDAHFVSPQLNSIFAYFCTHNDWKRILEWSLNLIDSTIDFDLKDEDHHQKKSNQSSKDESETIGVLDEFGRRHRLEKYHNEKYELVDSIATSLQSESNKMASFGREMVMQGLAKRGFFDFNEKVSFAELLRRLAQTSSLFSNRKSKQESIHKTTSIEQQGDDEKQNLDTKPPKLLFSTEQLLPIGRISPLHLYIIEFCTTHKLPTLLSSYLNHYNLANSKNEIDQILTSLGDQHQHNSWLRLLLTLRSEETSFEASLTNAKLATRSKSNLTLHALISSNTIKKRPLMALASLVFAPVSIEECCNSSNKTQAFHLEPNQLSELCSAFPLVHSAIFGTLPSGIAKSTSGLLISSNQLLNTPSKSPSQKDIKTVSTPSSRKSSSSNSQQSNMIIPSPAFDWVSSNHDINLHYLLDSISPFKLWPLLTLNQEQSSFKGILNHHHSDHHVITLGSRQQGFESETNMDAVYSNLSFDFDDPYFDSMRFTDYADLAFFLGQGQPFRAYDWIQDSLANEALISSSSNVPLLSSSSSSSLISTSSPPTMNPLSLTVGQKSRPKPNFGTPNSSLHSMSNQSLTSSFVRHNIPLNKASSIMKIARKVAFKNVFESTIVGTCVAFLELCDYKSLNIKVDVNSLVRMVDYVSKSPQSLKDLGFPEPLPEDGNKRSVLLYLGPMVESLGNDDEFNDSIVGLNLHNDSILQRQQQQENPKHRDENFATIEQLSSLLLKATESMVMNQTQQRKPQDSKTSKPLASPSSNTSNATTFENHFAQTPYALWSLPNLFNSIHKLPKCEMPLLQFARNDDWVSFLYFAQLFNYPADQVLRIIPEFKDQSLREHIWICIRQMIHSSSNGNGSSSSLMNSASSLKHSSSSLLQSSAWSTVKKETPNQSSNIPQLPDTSSTSTPSSSAKTVNEMFLHVLNASNRIYPGEALLQQCESSKRPLLAVLALCFPDVTILNCMIVWLSVSSPLSDMTKKIESEQANFTGRSNIVESKNKDDESKEEEIEKSPVLGYLEELTEFASKLEISTSNTNTGSRVMRLLKSTSSSAGLSSTNTSLPSSSNLVPSNSVLASYAQLQKQQLQHQQYQQQQHLQHHLDSLWTLSRFIVALCATHQVDIMIRALEIFDPKNVLLLWLRSLQCLVQYRFEKCSSLITELIAILNKHCVPEASNSPAPGIYTNAPSFSSVADMKVTVEDNNNSNQDTSSSGNNNNDIKQGHQQHYLFGNPLLGNLMWIRELVYETADLMIRYHMPTSFERREFLRILAECKVNNRYETLYNDVKVMENLGLLGSLDRNPNGFIVPQTSIILGELIKRQMFDAGREYAAFNGLNPHQVTLLEAEDSLERFRSLIWSHAKQNQRNNSSNNVGSSSGPVGSSNSMSTSTPSTHHHHHHHRIVGDPSSPSSSTSPLPLSRDIAQERANMWRHVNNLLCYRRCRPDMSGHFFLEKAKELDLYINGEEVDWTGVVGFEFCSSSQKLLMLKKRKLNFQSVKSPKDYADEENERINLDDIDDDEEFYLYDLELLGIEEAATEQIQLLSFAKSWFDGSRNNDVYHTPLDYKEELSIPDDGFGPSIASSNTLSWISPDRLEDLVAKILRLSILAQAESNKSHLGGTSGLHSHRSMIVVDSPSQSNHDRNVKSSSNNSSVSSTPTSSSLNNSMTITSNTTFNTSSNNIIFGSNAERSPNQIPGLSSHHHHAHGTHSIHHHSSGLRRRRAKSQLAQHLNKSDMSNVDVEVLESLIGKLLNTNDSTEEAEKTAQELNLESRELKIVKTMNFLALHGEDGMVGELINPELRSIIEKANATMAHLIHYDQSLTVLDALTFLSRSSTHALDCCDRILARFKVANHFGMDYETLISKDPHEIFQHLVLEGPNIFQLTKQFTTALRLDKEKISRILAELCFRAISESDGNVSRLAPRSSSRSVLSGDPTISGGQSSATISASVSAAPPMTIASSYHVSQSSSNINLNDRSNFSSHVVPRATTGSNLAANKKSGPVSITSNASSRISIHSHSDIDDDNLPDVVPDQDEDIPAGAANTVSQSLMVPSSSSSLLQTPTDHRFTIGSFQVASSLSSPFRSPQTIQPGNPNANDKAKSTIHASIPERPGSSAVGAYFYSNKHWQDYVELTVPKASVVGDELIRLMQIGLGIHKTFFTPSALSLKSNPALASVSFNVEIELIIRAFVCYRVGLDVLKQAKLFELIETRVPAFVQASQFKSLVRLITGIKQYAQLTYILDILVKCDCFDMLLTRNVYHLEDGDDKKELQLALFNFLKANYPTNIELMKLLFLRFNMFRENADLMQERGWTFLNSMKSRVDPQVLLQALDCFLEASAMYARDRAYGIEAKCMEVANLIQLQFDIPDVRIVNLKEAQALCFMTHCSLFEYGFIVSKAYGLTMMNHWISPIYQQVIVKGNWTYWEELQTMLPFEKPLLFSKVMKRIRKEALNGGQLYSNKSLMNTALTNTRIFLDSLDDHYLRLKYATDLGFHEMVQQLSQVLGAEYFSVIGASSAVNVESSLEISQKDE